MGKYVYIYYAGKDSAEAKNMEAWNTWFGQLGDKLVDAGNPFNDGGKIVHRGGVMDPRDPAVTGYTIVTADSMAEAVEMAKGCPLTASEHDAVGVYEALPM
jgi:hypothetical protein